MLQYILHIRYVTKLNRLLIKLTQFISLTTRDNKMLHFLENIFFEKQK